jgi:hypothetical protein
MTSGGGSLAIAFNTCVTEPPDDFMDRQLESYKPMVVNVLQSTVIVNC